MKPKLVLLRYLAPAIVAILLLACLVTLVMTFGGSSKYSETAQQATTEANRLRQKFNETEAPALPPPVLQAEVLQRMEHLDVLEPPDPNPLFQTAPTHLGEQAVVRDKVIRVPVKLTRFVPSETRVDPPGTVDVSVSYVREQGAGIIEIAGKQIGRAMISLQDDAGRRYDLAVEVRDVAVRYIPWKPKLVLLYPRPKDARGQLPARIGLVVIPDNLPVPTIEHPDTTHVKIFRKVAGEPDAAYVEITRHLRLQPPLPPEISALAAPTDRERAEWMAKYNIVEKAAPAAPAPAPVGPVVPEEAGAPAEPAAPTEAQEIVPPPNAFLFSDETVEAGEYYLYRIEAWHIVTEPPAETALMRGDAGQPLVDPATRLEVKDPYYTKDPVTPPALVTFSIARIVGNGAQVSVSRPDAAPINVQVQPGMRIGGVDITPTQRIDYSTDYIMVEAWKAPALTFRIRVNPRTGAMTYRVTTPGSAQAPEVLMVTTPRGNMRVKRAE